MNDLKRDFKELIEVKMWKEFSILVGIFLIELGDNLIRLLDIIGNDDIRWLKPYENRHI